MGHNRVCECLSEGPGGDLEERVHGATEGLRKVQVLNIDWITLETEAVDQHVKCSVTNNRDKLITCYTTLTLTVKT